MWLGSAETVWFAAGCLVDALYREVAMRRRGEEAERRGDYDYDSDHGDVVAGFNPGAPDDGDESKADAGSTRSGSNFTRIWLDRYNALRPETEVSDDPKPVFPVFSVNNIAIKNQSLMTLDRLVAAARVKHSSLSEGDNLFRSVMDDLDGGIKAFLNGALRHLKKSKDDKWDRQFNIEVQQLG